MDDQPLLHPALVSEAQGRSPVACNPAQGRREHIDSMQYIWRGARYPAPGAVDVMRDKARTHIPSGAYRPCLVWRNYGNGIWGTWQPRIVLHPTPTSVVQRDGCRVQRAIADASDPTLIWRAHGNGT